MRNENARGQVDVTGVRLETKRLILRPWEQTDLADFYDYAKVPGVGEMAGWAHHQSMEESQQILNLFIHEKKTLAIVEKETGKVIGSIGFEESDEDLSGTGRELGYVLRKEYWGRGLVPEAVRAVIGYCFDVLEWDWLTCAHFVTNTRSQRVIEKCGFQYQKDFLYQTRMGTLEPSKGYILYRKR